MPARSRVRSGLCLRRWLLEGTRLPPPTRRYLWISGFNCEGGCHGPDSQAMVQQIVAPHAAAKVSLVGNVALAAVTIMRDHYSTGNLFRLLGLTAKRSL